MKILAIDCTAGPASAALLEDGKIISSCYTNIGLTHSQTLMPMTQNALKHAKLELKDIDFFAINAGLFLRQYQEHRYSQSEKWQTHPDRLSDH